MKLLLVLLLLQDTGIFHVGGGVSAPTILSKVDPEYTEVARAAMVQGTVVLEVTLSEEGIPHVVKVVRPVGYGLDEAATAALEKWRFKPAMKDGMPVKVQMNVEVSFHTNADAVAASGAPPRAPAVVVAMDGRSPNTIYVATRSEIDKTIDGGNNWRLSGTVRNVVTLVIDPHNSSIVYAGSTSRGIFRSKDAGANWTQVGPHATRMLQIDPQDSSTLYAATIHGILKTVDGGNSWTDALPGFPFAKVSVNPNVSPSILAITDSGELFSSGDAGVHWQFIGTGLVDQNPPAAVPLRVVRFSPDDIIDHALAAPILMSPAEGAVFDTYPRHTTVTWAASPNAVSYIVEWDYSSNGTWNLDLAKLPEFGFPVQGTQFSFDFVGAQPGRWRVWPVNAAGQRGEPSQWRTLVIRAKLKWSL